MSELDFIYGEKLKNPLETHRTSLKNLLDLQF
jgi:hypothetical protein